MEATGRAGQRGALRLWQREVREGRQAQTQRRDAAETHREAGACGSATSAERPRRRSNDREADRPPPHCALERQGSAHPADQGKVSGKARNFSKYSPNIHTSLAEVKRRKLIDSGAIHLIGNFPLEARRLMSQSEFSLFSTEESNSYS